MFVATDVGGTFTDVVFFERDSETGRVSIAKIGKSHSTPPDFERGVINVLSEADVDVSKIDTFVHGCTVVINTITERTGAKVGLITTRGFADILEIARGNRPDLYNFCFFKPKPFIQRYLRREVAERIDYLGREVKPLALQEVAPILDDFKAEGIETVAIAFLHAYANPMHEMAVLEEVRARWPDVFVIASHQVIRAWREYERTNTTVLSAYVMPVTNRYLDRLENALVEQRFAGQIYIMQSSGGSDAIAGVRTNPITIMESGPASGMAGAQVLGRVIGEKNIIALDIGGTTAKCSLIVDGRLSITTDYNIEKTSRYAGYPVMTPGVDIVEIGNGGGSIAWVDEDGKFFVGPKSAGAIPGPAAYGQGGTEATTTDANLLTGRIDASYFLGGRIKADLAAARTAMQKLGDKLGQSVEQTARGVIRIAKNNMINALKLITVNRGYDPRDFILVAFGGGGPMLASALIEELHIPKVVIPVNSSVFSAWGMLMTDMRQDYLITRTTLLDGSDSIAKVKSGFGELEAQAQSEFSDLRGISAERLRLHRHADIRYKGQEHTVKIDLPDGTIDEINLANMVEEFHRVYEREYTYRLDNPVEIVTYHLVVSAEIEKPELAPLPVTGRTLSEALRGRRQVDFDLVGVYDSDIYERNLLEPGMEINGPAIIEEPDTTIVAFPNDRVLVDTYGNLILTRK